MARELTDIEKIFVLKNVDNLKPVEIAKNLGITANLVRSFLYQNSIKSICYNRQKSLTTAERDFIRQNFSDMRINRMAVKLNRPYHMIKKFIDAEKLNQKEVKTKIIRPVSVYSNRSYTGEW